MQESNNDTKVLINIKNRLYPMQLLWVCKDISGRCPLTQKIDNKKILYNGKGYY